MAYFNTCPRCGCHLDPGERCDCLADTPRPVHERAQVETARIAPPRRAYNARPRERAGA